MELLLQIFEVCILPLLGTLTIFLIKWINSKTDNTQKRVKNNSQELDIPFIDTSSDMIEVIDEFFETDVI